MKKVSKVDREDRLTFTEETFSINRDPQESKESKEIVGTSLIGLELELEGIHDNMDAYRSSFWSVISDGSLDQSGREFIFKKPFGGKTIVVALNSLNRILKERGVNPVVSIRTSTHVHIDTRDLSLHEYFSFILLYIVFERTLFTYCGKDREENQFCKPLYTLDIIERLANSFLYGKISDERHMKNELSSLIIGLHRNKYCALNLGSTMNLGSIEFRMHKGEWRKEKLIDWINILLRMKEYIKDGVSGDDWRDIFMNISALGVYQFGHSVFDKQFRLLNHEGVEEEIMQGIRVCQDILYIQELNTYEMIKNEEKEITREKEGEDKTKVSKRFLSYCESKRIKIREDNDGVKKKKSKKENVDFDINWFREVPIIRQERQVRNRGAGLFRNELEDN